MTGPTNLPNVSQKIIAKYGYALLAVKDLGPQLIQWDNLPVGLESNDLLQMELGVYLSLVISQGKGSANTGLYGPLLWRETPNFNLLLHAFVTHDPTVRDPRKLKHGVITMLVIFFPHDDDSLNKVRMELEDALFRQFPTAIREELNATSQVSMLARGKKVVEELLEEGQRIVMHQAIEDLLKLPSVRYMSIYSSVDQREVLPLIGEAEPAQLASLLSTNLSVGLVTTADSSKVGLVDMPHSDYFLFALFEDDFDVEDFLHLMSLVLRALPLLLFFTAVV